MVENKDRFIGKWQERVESGYALVRYKAKQFIQMVEDAAVIDEFDAELFFALVEKMTVFDGGRLVENCLMGRKLRFKWNRDRG